MQRVLSLARRCPLPSSPSPSPFPFLPAQPVHRWSRYLWTTPRTLTSTPESTPALTNPRKQGQGLGLAVKGAAAVGVTFALYYVFLSPAREASEETAENVSQSTPEPEIPDIGSPLAKPQIDATLRHAQASVALPSTPRSFPVTAFHRAQINANVPIEDYHAQDRWRDALLFSVFDGHSGTECASHLAEYLSSYIAHAFKAATPDTPTQDTLKAAFNLMDSHLLDGHFPVIQKPYSATDVLTNLRPAMAGACALVSYINKNDLFVACVGDSRAVLGVLGDDGKSISAVQLTDDQTCQNTSEYRRIIEEHPGEESSVIRRNRVLGGLMPTRAFGDSRYKWPVSIQQIISAFTKRRVPDSLKTPPYVTAEPVVTQHALTKKDQFLIMATDGIWDELSSDEAVRIVWQWMQTQKSLKNNSSPSDAIAEIPDASKYTRGRFRWSFEDDNAATSLLRNSLGGADSIRVGRLLGIPAPTARKFRDDMTVTVLFLDVQDEYSPTPEQRPWWKVWGRGKAHTPGLRSVDDEKVKKGEGHLPQWMNLLQRYMAVQPETSVKGG